MTNVIRSRVAQLAQGSLLAAVGVLLLFAPAALALLTIETVNLPAGSTGQLYNFAIGAVDGVPPYQWALVTPAATLPEGISLISNGTLTGEPEYEGTSNFKVSVTDSNGTTVVSPIYTLTVFAAGALAVASTQLEPAIINKSYNDTLHAAGGAPPYSWSLIDIVREPEYPGDPGSDLGSSLLALGLSFNPAQGRLEGVPSEVGVFALTVQVWDDEEPPAAAQGLALLTVSSTTSFSFETEQLPPATLNEFYSTTIETNAPANDSVTCQLFNPMQLATETVNESMPPGLLLYSNCEIQGTPLVAGSYSFLVEGAAAQGGFGEQSFSIQVNGPTVVKPSAGGCQSAPGGPALAGLLLLALTQIRRRIWRGRRIAFG